MNLSDLLDSPQAHHVNPRPIVFRIAGRNGKGVAVKVEEAKAVLRFVDEQARSEAYRDADKALREFYRDAGAEPPIDRLIQERNYHVLFRALRDADDPSKPLAATVLQLRSVLVLDEARRIFDEYDRWVGEEFPEFIDADKFKALVEDAKKNSFPDLLTSYGSDLIRRAMPSLLAALG